MRDDLLDAQAAVEWAVTQIPSLQQEFISWQRANPYPVVQEPDPDGGGRDVAVVYDQPFPLTFNAWVGAIINSLRSSLDLLAVALASRNGEKTNRWRHFPIFECLHDMIDPTIGIDGPERKKWLSQRERSAIKSLNPYRGGDWAIWPLHQLDIIRKHERLIAAKPNVAGYLMLGNRFARNLVIPEARRLENKTILCRLNPGEILTATQGNTLLSVGITFNEASLGFIDQEVVSTLRQIAGRIAEIIKLFDY